MKSITAIAQIGLLTLLHCTTAQAATVYKTVDEDGVVSFSDTKPASDEPVETLKINAQAPAGSAEEEQQRLEDMRETTDRMAADRMAREKQRAELRQQQPQTTPAQPDYTDYMGYSTRNSGYYRYPVRRPVLTPRPTPEHPIARPPIRPRPVARARR
jgi:septal ring-binding cell division protein DamX